MNRELEQVVETLRQLWAKIYTPKPAKEMLRRIDSFKEAFLDPLSKLAGQDISVKDIALDLVWKYDCATLRLDGEYLEVRYTRLEDGTIVFAPRKDWTVLKQG